MLSRLAIRIHCSRRQELQVPPFPFPPLWTIYGGESLTVAANLALQLYVEMLRKLASSTGLMTEPNIYIKVCASTKKCVSDIFLCRSVGHHLCILQVLKDIVNVMPLNYW